MPFGVSPYFGVIEIPIGQRFATPAPMDDWKFPEGRPPSHGSPLIPTNYFPWHKAKWAGSHIIAPKLSFQGFVPDGSKSKLYTLNTVVNDPTPVSDHHIISLRKSVEQLWAPKFHAHIHLEIDGEIFVKPLYQIEHGAFRAATVYEYWPSIISPTNPDKPYVFSIDGWVSTRNGHVHTWNAGASGKNTWKSKLFFDHGGSINEIIGNYNIERIEYSYILTKYYRTVFSQDGNNIFDMDYNSFIRMLHLQWYDSYDGQWLLGFAIDSGDYWTTPDNTEPYLSSEEGALPGRQPKAYYLGGRWNQGNVMLSSCKLPVRETMMNPWMSGGDTHDQISGYVIEYDHQHMLRWSVNRFVQQSVYASTLGESVPIKSAIRYEEVSTRLPWTNCSIEDPSFSITIEEPDKINEQIGQEFINTGFYGSSKWVKSLIGTKLVPYYRVTYIDKNNNVYVAIVAETEMYSSNVAMS